MARVSSEDRRDATLLIPAPEGVTIDPETGQARREDEDFEGAFDEWRAGLATEEKSGTVTAYRIPINERGELPSGFKGQTDLGSWAHDLYTLDELIDKIRAEFMGGETRWAVRFVGRVRGERGVRFNKIVMIGKVQGAAPAPARESTSDLLRAISEMNSNQQALMARLLETRAPAAGTGFDMAGLAALVTALGGAVSPIIAAMISKPSPAAVPPDFTGLAGLLTAVGKFAGGKGGGGNTDMGDWAEILKAVSPMAAPFLGVIAQRAALPAPAQPAQAALPAPLAAPPGAPVQPAPGAVAQRPTPPPPPPVVALADTPTPPPAAAQSTAAPQGPEQNPMLGKLMELKPEIDGIIVAGSQGNDGTQLANFYFDQLLNAPDDKYAQIAEFLSDPDCINKASFINRQILAPELQPFLNAFMTQIRARILAEDAEAQAGG